MGRFHDLNRPLRPAAGLAWIHCRLAALERNGIAGYSGPTEIEEADAWLLRMER
jgi:hypothetical protein